MLCLYMNVYEYSCRPYFFVEKWPTASIENQNAIFEMAKNDSEEEKESKKNKKWKNVYTIMDEMEMERETKNGNRSKAKKASTNSLRKIGHN